jgi:hypothetical protein
MSAAGEDKKELQKMKAQTEKTETKYNSGDQAAHAIQRRAVEAVIADEDGQHLNGNTTIV